MAQVLSVILFAPTAHLHFGRGIQVVAQRFPVLFARLDQIDLLEQIADLLVKLAAIVVQQIGQLIRAGRRLIEFEIDFLAALEQIVLAGVAFGQFPVFLGCWPAGSAVEIHIFVGQIELLFDAVVELARQIAEHHVVSVRSLVQFVWMAVDLAVDALATVRRRPLRPQLFGSVETKASTEMGARQASIGQTFEVCAIARRIAQKSGGRAEGCG